MITTEKETNQRAGTDSTRQTSLWAGIFYLLTFVSIPTLWLYSSVRNPSYILGSGPDTPVFLGAILEMIVALAGIATAVTLYPILKSKNQALSIGFVSSRILEAATIYIGIVSLLSIVTLRKSGAGVGALPIAQALGAIYYWIFFFGQSFIPAVNAILLGSLLFQSRLVPRALPLLGFFGAALLVTSWTGTLTGILAPVSKTSALFAFPIALWEFSLGIYLVFRGFKSSISLQS